MKKALRRPWLAALAVFVLVLCVQCSHLDYDTVWADDFAGYTLEGIAAAEGTLSEQFRLNVFLHPTPLPTGDEELVYIMGYPLILSVVYRCFGFDRVGYTSMLWYTLPSVLAAAGIGAVLFLFFRRRMDPRLAAGAGVLFAVHPKLIELVNSVYSDGVFLFFILLLFYALEGFDRARSQGKKDLLWGLVMGLALVGTYLVRLNGPVYIAAAGLMQLLFLRRDRRRLSLRELLPWAVLGVGMGLYRCFLPPATSNLSDYTRLSLKITVKNLLSCGVQFVRWLGEMFGAGLPGALRLCIIALLTAALLLGLRRQAKKDWPYLLLAAVNVAGTVLLPYNQQLRYYFPVLPFAMLFIACGAEAAGALLIARRPKAELPALVCLGLLTAASLWSAWSPNLGRVLRGEDVRLSGADGSFSAASVQMYRYIQENTPPESVIAFPKPRVLYLATGRLSFAPGSNAHRDEEADLFLSLDGTEEEGNIPSLTLRDRAGQVLYFADGH